MTMTSMPQGWILVLSLIGAAAAADTPPAPAGSSAQAEAGEPRANTSAPPVAETAPAASTDSPGPTVPAASRPPSKAAPSRTTAPTAAGAKAPGSADRLNLGTATVTGDREQPKVMYIVPWKSANIGDLSGKPMNSLLDEALTPVDRDEFRREVAYYDAVKGTSSQNAATGAAAKQGEK